MFEIVSRKLIQHVILRQDGELQTSSADDHGGAGGRGQGHRVCQRTGWCRALGRSHLLLYWQTTYETIDSVFLNTSLVFSFALYHNISLFFSVSSSPAFITGLLNNIGTHVDPILLIHRIKEGMEIPNLRDSLVKILQDYNLQVRNVKLIKLLTYIFLTWNLFNTSITLKRLLQKNTSSQQQIIKYKNWKTD